MSPFVISSLAIGSLSLLWLILELRGDRARGRLRCRRCWYPMPEVLPATCPECGRTASSRVQLLRTRRRPLRTTLAIGLLLLAQAGWLQPIVQKSGWVGIVPSPVLIRLLMVVPSDWIAPTSAVPWGTVPVNRPAPQYAVDRTLFARIRERELSPAQCAMVQRSLLARMMAESDPVLIEQWYYLVAASEFSNRPRSVHSTEGRPEALPPSPELEAAAARLVEIRVQQLSDSPQVVWFWFRTALKPPDFLWSDVSDGGVASQPVMRSLRSNEEALRVVLSEGGPREQAMAAALLVYCGRARLDDVPVLTAMAAGPNDEVGSLALGALWCLGLEHDQAFEAWLQVLQIPDPTTIPPRERRPAWTLARGPLRSRVSQSEDIARILAYGRVRSSPDLVGLFLESRAAILESDDLCDEWIMVPGAQPALFDRAVRELLADGGANSSQWQFMLGHASKEAVARNADRLLPMLDPAAGSWINGIAVNRLRALVTCPSEHRDAVVDALHELRDWHEEHREARNWAVTVGAINQLLDALELGIGDGKSNPGMYVQPSLPRDARGA